MKPVAVTGLGVVSPFGAGVKAYWEGISGGVCAIRPITLIDTEGFRCRIAAEVPAGIGGSARRTRADRLALTAKPKHGTGNVRAVSSSPCRGLSRRAFRPRTPMSSGAPWASVGRARRS